MLNTARIIIQILILQRYGNVIEFFYQILSKIFRNFYVLDLVCEQL